MQIPRARAESYLGELDGFADLSILAQLAALQLLPENAQTLFRLECGMQLVTRRRREQKGDRALPRARLARWVNKSPFASFEDPLNNPFTDEFTFFGGSYVVFPGNVENAFFILRRLARGLFLRGDVPDRATWGQAANFVLAAVRVSDEIARRAGLTRGIEPGTGSRPLIPPPTLLTALAGAVTFSLAELEELLGDLGGPAVLEELTQEPALVGVQAAEDYGGGAFFARPLLRIDESIVVLPHALLPAINHGLIAHLLEAGYRDLVASSFRQSVASGVAADLAHIGMQRLHPRLPAGELDERVHTRRDLR
jgi:hypothetical protein